MYDYIDIIYSLLCGICTNLFHSDQAILFSHSTEFTQTKAKCMEWQPYPILLIDFMVQWLMVYQRLLSSTKGYSVRPIIFTRGWMQWFE